MWERPGPASSWSQGWTHMELQSTTNTYRRSSVSKRASPMEWTAGCMNSCNYGRKAHLPSSCQRRFHLRAKVMTTCRCRTTSVQLSPLLSNVKIHSMFSLNSLLLNLLAAEYIFLSQAVYIQVLRFLLFWNKFCSADMKISCVLLMLRSRFSCCGASAGDGYKRRLARRRQKSHVRDPRRRTTFRKNTETLGPFFSP